jgi:peptidoglycan/LPS O-acetylase OafA/YrhL
VGSGIGVDVVAVAERARDARAEERATVPLRGFRPDIQALRGLAILAVVLHHAGSLLPGGFVGVDVFFVISGFVIGRRLLTLLSSSHRMTLASFYVHRARRILPALGLMLAVVVLLAPLLAPIGANSVTSPTGVAAALFSANAYLYRVTGGGYFDPAADLNPLLHTWSLSVEEQFYFVIPALLLLGWRFGRPRWGSLVTLRVLVVGLTTVSLIACVWVTSSGYVGGLNGERLAFYSPVTRAWEFAAGLALVLLPVQWLASAKVRPLLVVSGLSFIGASTVLYSDATVFPGVAAVLPVVGAALVIYGGTSADGNGHGSQRRTGPMVWLGDISYSWYLWHWPVIVFAGALWPAGGSFPLIVAAAASLLPAWLSYRIVEQPFRATTKTRARPTLALAGCCVVAPLVAAAIAGPVDSLVGRQAERAFAAIRDGSALHVDARMGCDSSTPLGDRAREHCTWGDDTAAASVVLLGDSYAGQFSEMLIEAAENENARLQIATRNSCPFSDVAFEKDVLSEADAPSRVCRRFVLGSVEYLETHPPDVAVIATATDAYLTQDWITLIDPTTGRRATDEAKGPVFEAGMERLVARLRAAGSRVVVINDIPTPDAWDIQECPNLTVLVDLRRCLPPPFTMSDRANRAAKAIEDRAARLGGAEVWTFDTEICPADRCTPVRNDELVWRDPVHISVATSRALAPTASRYLDRVLSMK